MNIKRIMNTTTTTTTKTPTFYCSFCCRHILITFVGMTLLIVNYSVSTAQMSAEPQKNENCINSSSGRCVKSDKELSFINGHNYYSKKVVGTRNEIISNSKSIAPPETPVISKIELSLKDGPGTFINSNTSRVNKTEFASADVNFRNARFFGLFGSNFSLSYNLTLSSGNSVGNITVVAPAPAPAYYYYSPAPSYPYYPYYGYYDPNAYNPYASSPQYYYNPGTGYVYYG